MPFTLSNKTGEINTSISQSYIRITGGYAGPTGTSAVATCGFAIRKGDNSAGICVLNCGTQFAKNKIEHRFHRFTQINCQNNKL